MICAAEAVHLPLADVCPVLGEVEEDPEDRSGGQLREAFVREGLREPVEEGLGAAEAVDRGLEVDHVLDHEQEGAPVGGEVQVL